MVQTSYFVAMRGTNFNILYGFLILIVVKTIRGVQENTNVPFEEAWDLVGPRYKDLQNFCGGLATVFPSTWTVESDFSVVKWEKDWVDGLVSGGNPPHETVRRAPFSGSELDPN